MALRGRMGDFPLYSEPKRPIVPGNRIQVTDAETGVVAMGTVKTTHYDAMSMGTTMEITFADPDVRDAMYRHGHDAMPRVTRREPAPPLPPDFKFEFSVDGRKINEENDMHKVTLIRDPSRRSTKVIVENKKSDEFLVKKEDGGEGWVPREMGQELPHFAELPDEILKPLLEAKRPSFED